jgi:site-specific recombinase XerD
LEAVAGLRNRVALATAYAAGLRIGEVCRLKVGAIQSAAGYFDDSAIGGVSTDGDS